MRSEQETSNCPEPPAQRRRALQCAQCARLPSPAARNRCLVQVPKQRRVSRSFVAVLVSLEGPAKNRKRKVGITDGLRFQPTKRSGVRIDYTRLGRCPIGAEGEAPGLAAHDFRGEFCGDIPGTSASNSVSVPTRSPENRKLEIERASYTGSQRCWHEASRARADGLAVPDAARVPRLCSGRARPLG